MTPHLLPHRLRKDHSPVRILYLLYAHSEYNRTIFKIKCSPSPSSSWPHLPSFKPSHAPAFTPTGRTDSWPTWPTKFNSRNPACPAYPSAPPAPRQPIAPAPMGTASPGTFTTQPIVNAWGAPTCARNARVQPPAPTAWKATIWSQQPAIPALLESPSAHLPPSSSALLAIITTYRHMCVGSALTLPALPAPARPSVSNARLGTFSAVTQSPAGPAKSPTASCAQEQDSAVSAGEGTSCSPVTCVRDRTAHR